MMRQTPGSMSRRTAAGGTTAQTDTASIFLAPPCQQSNTRPGNPRQISGASALAPGRTDASTVGARPYARFADLGYATEGSVRTFTSAGRFASNARSSAPGSSDG